MGCQSRINNRSLDHLLKRACFGLMVASAASGVNAQLTQNLAIDTKALALGNAVTADPPGINSIHYNSAGLAMLDGRHSSVTILAVSCEYGVKLTSPERMTSIHLYGYALV